MKGTSMDRTDRNLGVRRQGSGAGDQRGNLRMGSKTSDLGPRTSDLGLLTLVSDPRPPTPHSGFTLLEVLVALAVLAVALVGLLGLHNRNLLLTIRAERLSTATLLAREVLTRTQLEGQNATKLTSGDFSDLHPGQYSEFRWRRTVRPAPVEGLWELRVNVLWGEREDERCELTLFTPLN